MSINQATLRKELRKAIGRLPTERERSRSYNKILNFKLKLRYEKERNLSLIAEAQRQAWRAESAEKRVKEQVERAEAAERKLNDVLPGYVAQCAKLLEDNDALRQRAEVAEARKWQDAGIPCPSCGEDAVRVSCDPVAEDYAIEHRVYHCLECNKAWVKPRILAILSPVPFP